MTTRPVPRDSPNFAEHPEMRGWHTGEVAAEISEDEEFRPTLA